MIYNNLTKKELEDIARDKLKQVGFRETKQLIRQYNRTKTTLIKLIIKCDKILENEGKENEENN